MLKNEQDVMKQYDIPKNEQGKTKIINLYAYDVVTVDVVTKIRSDVSFSLKHEKHY